MNISQMINEAVDVRLYKKLLRVLADYSENMPTTECDRLLEIALDKGKSILPKDKVALAILKYILNDRDTVPAIIQHLLNDRFSCLPADIKPMYRDGNRRFVAFYTRGIEINDKVKSLINFEGEKGGNWSDIDGNKVTIDDMTSEEEK